MKHCALAMQLLACHPPATSDDLAAPPPPVASPEAIRAWYDAGNTLAWRCEHHALTQPGHVAQGLVRHCQNSLTLPSDEGWLPHAAATLETFDANGGRMALALLHHTRAGADMGTWFWFEELHGATLAVGWGNAERARSTCVGCHSLSPDAPLWWLSPPQVEVP